MQDTRPGHILIVEDELYYNAKQGDAYKYLDRNAWHVNRSNCGQNPKIHF